ncbi:MAG: BatA domain-containing protein [Lysobacterales bacterium]
MPDMLSGLSVINPAAWWALLALCIPLIIHLFSKSRGRLVRIGHIDLIRQARKLQVTELKLTQWLLLLLRLAIFTLAALILAGLATAGLNSSKANTIYLTPGWLSSAGTKDFTALLNDADQAAEHRVFLLQPGFPALDRQQLETGQLETDRQQLIRNTTEFSNTWALLSERLSLERHLGGVTVYTTDYMLQFGFHKPDLPRQVDWRIASPQMPPVFESSPIRALIVFDPDRAADAKRLDAVLAVLKQHRLPKLTWESVDASQTGDTRDDPDWLILLGDKVFEPAMIETFGSPQVVFTDSSGSVPEHQSQYINLPFYPFTRFRLEHYTRPSVRGNEKVLLTTASASPLLQESYYENTRVIQFNSRITPRWNSLAEQPGFPELFLQLMSDKEQAARRYADARLSDLKLLNQHDDAMTDLPLPHRSLQGMLAALLAFLWIIERWLSERKPRERR